MPRSGKNNERIEQVPRGRKKSAKVEPLRQTTEQPNKLYNDLAKFPSENPYPVLRIHKDGTVLYANKASEGLLKARSSGMGQPAPAQWHQLVKKALSSGQVIREETEQDGRVFAFRVVPITDNNYVNFYGVDITERKRAEEMLRESEDKFRHIFDYSVIGKSITSPLSGEMQVNKALCEMLGYSREELKVKKWQEITHPDDIEDSQKAVDSILSGQKDSVQFFKRYVHKNGSVVWADVSTSLRRDNKGKPLYLMTSVVNITERKRAEEALRTSEERFRLVIENAPFGYYRVGKDGLWQHVNPVWERMHGYSLKDIIGKPFEITQTKEDVEKARQYVKRALAGETITGEFSRITKQGTVKYHSFNIQPVRRGNEIVAIEGFISDITEQMQARENLQKERNLLRMLIDHIPDPVYIKDINCKFIACNKALLKFWGIKNDNEVIGKTDFDFFDNSRAKEYFNEEQTVIQTKRPFINREGQCPDKAGNLHSFLVTKLPLQDSHGNVTGIVGINRDITEHRIAEKKLLEDQKQLKKLAAQLALTEERERHRIARNLHDQVSQSLALAKIKLDALLASQKAPPLSKTLKETNDTIEKAIQNVRSLTFDLSYPILYELGFEAAVAEWLNEQVQKKHGIITEFFDDGLPKPLDDDVRALLFRNVRELLINIIKHARADKVIVSVNKTGDSIKITVEDNGVGLNVEEINTSRKGGLGLFSIRESIAELCGSFEIESKPGAGCKVTITAPLKGIGRPKEE
ncbi:MAG: PAS domain S-box protein [Sedimentisphaerales bacterium]